MKDRHKKQISENIQHASNRYGKKRHFRIADSPENRPQNIVGYDKDRPGAAYADVDAGFIKGLSGSVEKLRDYAGTEDEDDCQNNGKYRKETNTRSDGAARFLRLYSQYTMFANQKSKTKLIRLFTMNRLA